MFQKLLKFYIIFKCDFSTITNHRGIKYLAIYINSLFTVWKSHHSFVNDSKVDNFYVVVVANSDMHF